MSTFDSRLVSPLYPRVKQRNELFDYMFYDTGSLTSKDKAMLSPFGNHEGSVVVVTPSQSKNSIYGYKNTNMFLESNHKAVQALVVAGVGSSVIGTAALARNVADAYDIEVAGIVSGYGASDLISEAIGGWFFYGATDAFRHQLRQSMDNWDLLVKNNPFGLAFHPTVKRSTSPSPATSDISALTAVLEAATSNLSLVVGHSKGSLLLDYALERIAKKLEGREHRYFDALNIVTLGAVTNFPPQFNKIHQYIGSIDWFGGLNSRFDVAHNKVINAWHHLNTQFPWHLSAETVLRDNVSLK